MNIEKRFFCIGDQWNVAHLPEQPSGYGVLLIGDSSHFVEAQSSSWIQHPERLAFIKQLRTNGYTVFSSNLYGRHWGSERACLLAEQLYHLMMRKEILNQKIHIIAEGIGALVAVQLLQTFHKYVRSITLINPCLFLDKYLMKEKISKLFYKRFIKEFSSAHHIQESEIEEQIKQRQVTRLTRLTVPMKILHEMNHSKFPLEDHTRIVEKQQLVKNLAISIHFPNKPFSSYARPTINFMKKYEHTL